MTSKDTRTRAITAGLSATGAAAGVGGLVYGLHDMGRAMRAGKKIPLKTKALIPLEVAGLGGEIMATKILHGDVKRRKAAAVSKSELNVPGESTPLDCGTGSTRGRRIVQEPISKARNPLSTKPLRSALGTAAEHFRADATNTGHAGFQSGLHLGPTMSPVSPRVAMARESDYINRSVTSRMSGEDALGHARGHAETLRRNSLVAGAAGGSSVGAATSALIARRKGKKKVSKSAAGKSLAELTKIADARTAAKEASVAAQRGALARRSAPTGVGSTPYRGLNGTERMHGFLPTHHAVGKARGFDAEADRQRRLGMYGGLAGGGAIVAADRLADTVKVTDKRRVGFKRGKGKKGLALTGVTAGLAALSAGTLRRGVSERNQAWT